MPLKYYRLCTGIWSVIMLLVLFLPGSVTPEVTPLIPHLDKLIHIGIFGVFSWLLAMSFPISFAPKARIERKQGALYNRLQFYLLFGVILFALLSEIIQAYLIPGRGGDFWDFMADLIGIALGALLSRIRL